MHEGEPVRGREIDSRLPFLGAALQAVRRYPDLHWCFLRRLFQHKAISACSVLLTWPICRWANHLQMVGPSAAGASAAQAGFGLQGQCVERSRSKTLASVRA